MVVDESDLKHEEIWDDTVLIDSWNDALREYKKYHSIHAKGGSIRDLEQAEADSSKANETPKIEESTRTQGHVPDLSVEDADAADDVPAEKQSESTQPAHGLGSTPKPFPSQAILGTVRDENLKKLLMSWYYAGYYTGLYEGQQQAQHQPQQKTEQQS
ncbi:Survival motor neuron-like protein [Trichoderma ghanense]|uniref:Survival motor neuron-like protein n=1 Tax=Trichoderma ghanense TaxID=65468 RepID=A0ABY2H2P8_9HYPO